MHRRRHARLTTFTSCVLLVLACALLAAGCGSKKSGGGGSGGNAKAGKKLFVRNCGGCHTLGDAKTKGAVGPNLDDLQPDSGMVKTQVKNGGGGMPSFEGSLSKKQINDVAAYVSDAAGK